MSENLRNSINSLFSVEPDAEEKAWDLIHEFYHLVLTKMERDGITRADLARKLGKSRASVSQMFNKTPNLSIIKMMEIADAVGLEISLKEGCFQNTSRFITTSCVVLADYSDIYSEESSLSINCGTLIKGSFSRSNKDSIYGN